MLGVFAASSAFALGGSKFEQELEKEQGAVKFVREVMKGGYDVITTAELDALMKSGEEIVLIDTMPFEESYKKEHVPGAKQFLFPIPDMATWDSKETAGKSEADYKTMLGADVNKKIVIYCGFVKCTRSHNGAMWAKKMGYAQVLRYSGGIFAWKGAGYKVDSLK